MSQLMRRRLIRYSMPTLVLFVFAIWNFILYAQDANPTPRQGRTVDTPTPVNDISSNSLSTPLPGNLDQVTFVDDGQSHTIRQLVPQDWIMPLYNPRFTDNPEAYDDAELIMGVEINGDARAYSVGHLVRREMVNDTVGGTPILVTW
jgi:hypothetical protein